MQHIIVKLLYIVGVEPFSSQAGQARLLFFSSNTAVDAIVSKSPG